MKAAAVRKMQMQMPGTGTAKDLWRRCTTGGRGWYKLIDFVKLSHLPFRAQVMYMCGKVDGSFSAYWYESAWSNKLWHVHLAGSTQINLIPYEWMIYRIAKLESCTRIKKSSSISEPTRRRKRRPPACVPPRHPYVWRSRSIRTSSREGCWWYHPTSHLVVVWSLTEGYCFFARHTIFVLLINQRSFSANGEHVIFRRVPS